MTYKLAVSMGWQCVWIKTGKEAIRQAVKEALNAANVVRHERAKAELFKIILENTKEAIIAVDHEGYITAFNKAAYKILKIPRERKMNKRSVEDIFPFSDLFKVMETGEEKLGVIGSINDIMIVSNRVPIKAAGFNAGVVVTFQNVDKIKEIESKIRKELSSKGLIAKYSFGNIIGSSEKLNSTIQIAYKYSQVDSNILLIGETGTGKELFAQSIHNSSNRKFESFVAVNCAALPENLLESELFGYVEGAFSGAAKGGKVGLFELAHKGSIFLDEVGELPLSLQAKLLRVLQEREIRKIGDDKVVPIDVRIISATNIDLKEKVKSGEFRQDLLFRLDVLNLKIPSLKERKEDIEYIAKHFIEKYCKKFNKDTPSLTCEAVEDLKRYGWPGNIRELRNICERLVVLTDSEEIKRGDVKNLIGSYEEKEENLKNGFNVPEEKSSSVEEMDIETVLRLMQVMKVNKTEVAKILGVSRTTLWRRLKDKI